MKIVEVAVSETNYGFVRLTVDDNATQDEIFDLATHATQNGAAYWNESDTHVGEILSEVKNTEIENPDSQNAPAKTRKLAYGNVEDFKTLRIGDILGVCDNLENTTIIVTDEPFYNADSDEKGWEVETNCGVFSIWNDFEVIGHFWECRYADLDTDWTNPTESSCSILIEADSYEDAKAKAAFVLETWYDRFEYEVSDIPDSLVIDNSQDRFTNSDLEKLGYKRQANETQLETDDMER